MNPGDTFGVALLPNGSFQQIAGRSDLYSDMRPLFSLATANPNQGFQFGQIADVTGQGSTFVLEDLRLDGTSDRDYNDVIFQVRGAIGSAVSLDEVIDSSKDWRNSEIGQKIIGYPGFETEDADNDSVFRVTPEMGFLKEPIKITDDIWYLGAGIPPSEWRIVAPNNLKAADTTNADRLWSGGGLGLNLNGSGVTVGVWDAGAVRNTHQEFGSRVTRSDASSGFDNHATHVAGTIGATGIDPNARGMANQANIRSYDWNSDLSELGTASQLGVTLSNHSYGYFAGWDARADWSGIGVLGNVDSWFGDRGRFTEAESFGKYNTSSRDLDQVLSNNPNLLSVWAAGNDRGGRFTNTRQDNTYITYFSQNPGIPSWQGSGYYKVPNSGSTFAPSQDGGLTGYDTLQGGGQTAKNTLVVGAINPITADPYSKSDVKMSTFSNWGMTDDGRLKVDVVADGVGVYSTLATTNNSYASYSGTSMAAPNVTGTAALLTQHYKNLYGKNPSSATLKATIIHTTLDAGNIGPDPTYGWGVVDGAAAAVFLNNAKQGTNAKLFEATYGGAVQTYQVTSNGSEPLKATVVWTDPPGTAHGSGLDETTRTLVNDLDIWVTAPNGSILRPWTLNPSNPSAPAVRIIKNSVDNVEQVLVDNPLPGNYTIHLGHSGNSFTQPYSLLVSGLGTVARSTISLTTTDPVAAETILGQTPNPGRFTVTRSNGNNSQAETIYYTVSGTATNGNDYASLPGSITIPANQTSVDISINVFNDSLYESTESVNVSLYSNGSYNLSTNTTGAVWIYDNDPSPTEVMRSKIGAGSRAPGLFQSAFDSVLGSNYDYVPIANAYRWGNGWTQELRDSRGNRVLIMLEDSATTAHVVLGANLDEYLFLGGPVGRMLEGRHLNLGYPRSNENVFTNPRDGKRAVWQQFAADSGKSRICNLNGSASVATWGTIGSLYTDMNGAYSWLGMPTRREYIDGNTIFSDFQGGRIAHNRNTGRTEAFQSGVQPSWRQSTQGAIGYVNISAVPV